MIHQEQPQILTFLYATFRCEKAASTTRLIDPVPALRCSIMPSKKRDGPIKKYGGLVQTAVSRQGKKHLEGILFLRSTPFVILALMKFPGIVE